MGTFTYFAIFVGLGTVIFSILLGLLLIIDYVSEFSYKVADIVIWIVILTMVILTLILTPYIVHNLLNIKYPEKSVDITAQIYNNNEELKELTHQINLLKNALESPKELTLRQIEDVLLNSLKYSEKMKILLCRNDSIIGLLKDEIEIERQNAETSKEIADNLRSLTKKQIETVKFIITEDAKEASKNSFINGVLLSIPIGFLMSILASFVLKRWGGKVKTSINKNAK